MSKRLKQVRLTVEELHEIKWLLGSLLVMLSLWSLWPLELDSHAHLLVCLLVVGLALLRPEWVVRIPVWVWRPASILVLFIIGVDLILHLPEFMAPLLRMVLFLLIIKTLAPRKRRDDLQVILLSLFCLVVSGVLTVSLLFAFQILLFTPLAMGLLFVVCLLDQGPESHGYISTWKGFRWWHLIQRVAGVIDFRVLMLGASLFTVVVVVSTLLFVLTPRFNLEHAIPYLQLKGETRSGFSEEIRLGEVREIIEDNSVSMRIDTPSMAVVDASPYWRILVLDKYDDGYFRMSRDLLSPPIRDYGKKDVRELMGRDLVGNGVALEGRSGALWTIYLEGGVTQFLPLPGVFHSLRFDGRQNIVLMPGLHVVGLDSVQQSVFSYQIMDLAPTHRYPASVLDVEAFSRLPLSVQGDDLGYPLTTLELSLNQEDRDYIAEINDTIRATDTEQSVAKYSEALTKYLRQNFNYSLRPDEGGGRDDPVVWWLRNAKAGHCEYFASAFILMAREAGYPARLAVGFAGGSWNLVEEFFVVRNSDAHAWVEVYDASTQEWLRVDPTPGNGSDDPDVPIPSNIQFEAGWDAWLDGLRIQWYRRIVNFEQSDQVELASNAKDMWTRVSGNLSDWFDSLKARFKHWVLQPFSADSLFAIIFCTIVVVSVYFFWRIRFTLLGLLFRLLRRPAGLDPVRKQARLYIKRLKKREISDSVQKDLEALRFGPAVEFEKAKLIFVRARVALRKKF